MVAMKSIAKRCAVYTRKSTEEGLEQDFNSLHAQREACEAYIISQRSEGWHLVSEEYDDGGYSGGTLKRPALERLLEDIKAKKIDIVVVYKIDRLTRSLMDFSKLVEVFDEYGVTFVSVTQSFNTTTSMGRLTLNMLLSFAQFEREVTSERIRDKMAASKKKGMWMGGVSPLGYKVENRSLIADEAHVDLARHIFDRYISLKSVKPLKQELDAKGIRTPIKMSKNGNKSGGVFFSRGALYAILKNPIYIGKIAHKGNIYDGQHEGIIDEAVWHKAQAIMSSNRVERKEVTRSRHLLQGSVFDKEGNAYSPTYTSRKNKKYCYYISQNLLNFKDHPNGLIARLPAHDFEDLIYKTVWQHLSHALKDSELSTIEYINANQQRITMKNFLRQGIKKIEVHLDNIFITLNSSGLKEVFDKYLNVSVTVEEATCHIDLPYKTRRKGHGAIVIATGEKKDVLDLPPDELKKLVQGISWRDDYFSGMTLKEIAQRENCSDRHISQMIKRSFDILAA
tara:strand:- start:3614 stop:5140 length:1527 start_codon:yes stop_codon:yes gene_type:complete